MAKGPGQIRISATQTGTLSKKRNLIWLKHTRFLPLSSCPSIYTSSIALTVDKALTPIPPLMLATCNPCYQQQNPDDQTTRSTKQKTPPCQAVKKDKILTSIQSNNHYGSPHHFLIPLQKLNRRTFHPPPLKNPTSDKKIHTHSPSQIYPLHSPIPNEYLISPHLFCSTPHTSSILGPVPGSANYQQPLPLHQIPHPTPCVTPNHTMSNLSKEDEALIEKFIGLSTQQQQGTIVSVPSHATSSSTWERCLLVKIITDRTVLEQPFFSAMLKAWGADPAKTITPVERNCFLLECTNETDLNKAIFGGPWSYRGDMVTMKQVLSPNDLKANTLDTIDIWVQLYNVPVHAFTTDGLGLIAGKIGTPLSLPSEGFVMGKRFVKLKIRVRVNQPLKDCLKIPHPTMGDLLIYCVYEKLSRACTFCGLIGHEMSSCQDHTRLSQIMVGRTLGPEISAGQLLAQKFGSWRIDPALLPQDNLGWEQTHQSSKRSFGQTGPSASNEDYHSSPPLNNLSLGFQEDTAETNNPIKRPRPARQNAPAVDP